MKEDKSQTQKMTRGEFIKATFAGVTTTALGTKVVDAVSAQEMEPEENTRITVQNVAYHPEGRV